MIIELLWCIVEVHAKAAPFFLKIQVKNQQCVLSSETSEVGVF